MKQPSSEAMKAWREWKIYERSVPELLDAFAAEQVHKALGMIPPPNPYSNWPAVGSTTEKFLTDGDWAQLTREWLRLREEWLNDVSSRS